MMSKNGHPNRSACRLAVALVLPVLLGVGCSADPDQASGPDDEIPELPGRPPPVRLLAGAKPDGALIYESWVTDGELRTSEPVAIPADLVVVPWRQGEEVTFEVDSGQRPVWVDVLAFDQLPDDRVPNTEPERIQCLANEADPPCQVDDGPGDALTVTVGVSGPSEILILNIGWARPEGSDDQGSDLPPQVSASWAFAVDTSP